MKELEILFCDNHLLAIAKPAGLLTQPVPKRDEPSLEKQAKEWVKNEFNKPAAVFLHAVHRIDKPVSGVVLFARTGKALSRLNKSIREKEPSKEYLAIVSGRSVPERGNLVNHLIHGSHKAKLVKAQSPGAKKSVLEYRKLKQEKEFSLLQINLITGRYHQIRIQLSAAGFPIVGDTRYGSPKKLPGNIIALHHHSLSIRHPVRKEKITFTAPVPRHASWSQFPRD